MSLLEEADKKYQERYTKQIVCPEHKDHNATLYLYGHKYAGIWECNVEGMSDSCAHESTQIETVESWPTGPEDDGYTSEAEVCDACEVTVER